MSLQDEKDNIPKPPVWIIPIPKPLRKGGKIVALLERYCPTSAFRGLKRVS